MCTHPREGISYNGVNYRASEDNWDCESNLQYWAVGRTQRENTSQAGGRLSSASQYTLKLRTEPRFSALMYKLHVLPLLFCAEVSAYMKGDQEGSLCSRDGDASL